MATSPNYAWAEPDNSSLVKNGASDIRTLGDAIDTSVWNVGFGQAGKNKIINGDFSINQRNFTSTTTTSTFMYDRFSTIAVGGTSTFTAQTFALGTAPVTGYEGKNYLDVASTGQSAAGDVTRFSQSIESVRTFANQTVTISFWAKAATGTPKVAVEIQQVFGSGGSPSAAVNNYFGQVTLTTSWARYSVTAAVPSITGKTIGTAGDDRTQLNLYTSAGTTFNSRTGSLGIQTATISFWGMQAEYGSKATPFQTASGGSPQAELAMCQRYYWRQTASSAYTPFGMGNSTSTTQAQCLIYNPVPMRTQPASIDFSGSGTLVVSDIGSYNQSATGLTLSNGGTIVSEVGFTVASGLTANRIAIIRANNSVSSFLGMSAEL